MMEELGAQLPLIFNTLYIIIFWFLMTLIPMLAIIGISIYMKYRIKIIVFERRSSGMVRIKNVYCRRKEERGVTFWKPLLPLFNKEWIEPPLDLGIVGVSGRRDVVLAYKPADGGFQFFKYDLDTNLVDLVPQDIRFWMMQETKKTEEIYKQKGFMEQYGAIVGLAIFAIVFLVVCILILKSVDKAIGMGQQVVSVCTENLHPTLAAAPI